MLGDLWYKNAVVYSIDVETFMDSNGDGCGDFEGLSRRLDYLESLGVDALWLAPFQPSPRRDDGYDITDYYGVDPRIGTRGSAARARRARRCMTGTCGRNGGLPTGAAASSSRASSDRPGRSIPVRTSTTFIASTSFSRISTWTIHASV